MLDTTTVTNFIKAFPAGKFPNTERILSISFHTESEIKERTQRLLINGYLGYLSIAHDEVDDVAIMLEPQKSLADATVVIASGYFTEATSIASRLSNFVVGRCAQRSIIQNFLPDIQEHQQEVLDFATEFGDINGVSLVIENAEAISSTEKKWIPTVTWEKGLPGDSLAQILAASWKYKKAEMGEWLVSAISKYPDNPIVLRLYVTQHLITHSGVDLSKYIAQLILANDICDPTYVSTFARPGLGTWEIEGLVEGVKYLQQSSIKPDVPESLWVAVQAFAADPKGYDGELHFVAAQEIAKANPTLAYTQLCNAVGYNVRSGKKDIQKMVEFAHSLAVKNGWSDIAEVLGWSKD